MEIYLAMLTGMPGMLAAILAILGFLWLAGTARADEKAQEPTRPANVTTNFIKGLNRTEIQKKLQKLSETPPPKDLKPGACCYEMAAPPDRAEYVCPKCGEKTLYSKEQAWFVEQDVPNARRGMVELQKVAKRGVALDESQFCRHWRPIG